MSCASTAAPRHVNLTYTCPHCDQAARRTASTDQRTITCPHCGQGVEVPADAFSDGRLRRCLVCPSRELFVRKDFPQRLGVTIVAVGFALSCVTWYLYQPLWTFAVLFATVLVDVALYLVIGSAVMCYRCHAQYRWVTNLEDFGHFDLETHERYRQQAIRLAAAHKAEGTPLRGEVQ